MAINKKRVKEWWGKKKGERAYKRAAEAEIKKKAKAAFYEEKEKVAITQAREEAKKPRRGVVKKFAKGAALFTRGVGADVGKVMRSVHVPEQPGFFFGPPQPRRARKKGKRRRQPGFLF